MRIKEIRLPTYPVWNYKMIQDMVELSFSEVKLNGRQDVLMIVDDHTRPITFVPRIILDYLIESFGEERVAVLVASGLHRASSYQEIENKLGNNLKKVRLYTHNPMTTPSSFLGENYFRVGINTVLPHLHTSHTSCGKLICPGIKNYTDIVSFHTIPKTIAEISMDSHKINFDIGFDVYINSNWEVVDLVEQDPIRNKFKKEYYTVDMPFINNVAILSPLAKKSDFQQTLNVVNIMKSGLIAKQGGIIAIEGEMPEGIGIHYLFQQPNGIKPVKYDEVFSSYFLNQEIAIISENVSYHAVQEYFNRAIKLFSNILEFGKYVDYIYGKNEEVNHFIGADMMIGREDDHISG